MAGTPQRLRRLYVPCCLRVFNPEAEDVVVACSPPCSCALCGPFWATVLQGGPRDSVLGGQARRVLMQQRARRDGLGASLVKEVCCGLSVSALEQCGTELPRVVVEQADTLMLGPMSL
jgi:hypothetical protein